MIEFIKLCLNQEFYTDILNQLGIWSYLLGLFLAFIESFLPFLPLALFVTVNIVVFGFVKGYFISYVGTVLGNITVFFLLRMFGRKHLKKQFVKHEKAEKLLKWIHCKGIIPLMALLIFPFTPSFLICGLAAFAEIDSKEYMAAVIFGKLFMILSLSFIGASLKDFFVNPIKSIIYIIVMGIFVLIGKVIIKRYEERLKK